MRRNRPLATRDEQVTIKVASYLQNPMGMDLGDCSRMVILRRFSLLDDSGIHHSDWDAVDLLQPLLKSRQTREPSSSSSLIRGKQGITRDVFVTGDKWTVYFLFFISC